MPTTRRIFCIEAATLLASRWLPAQSLHPQRSTARPDVALIDHDRILRAAQGYLSQSPTPLTTLPCKRSPGSLHDFYSEAEDYWPDPAKPAGTYIQRSGPANPAAFTAHRDALLKFAIQVSALAAAFVLTKEQQYAEHAIRHLRAWFVDPATSMTPSLLYGRRLCRRKRVVLKALWRPSI